MDTTNDLLDVAVTQSIAAKKGDIFTNSEGTGGAKELREMKEMQEMQERTVVRVKRARVPKRLGPYFQEYDFKALNLERDANLIIQRTLEFGTIREIQWLFRVYGKARVKRFIRELGERGLSRRAFNYWKMLLGVRTWRKSPFAISREQLWPYS